jgi:Cu/Ag efflux pump CusA
LSLVPGTNITIGQPISHRIDHMLSGTRANIAVKIFGPDLFELRELADQVKKQMENVPGAVDIAVDQQTDVPQVRIKPDRQKMALYGLTIADLDHFIDVAYLGIPASQIYEEDQRFDLMVRYAEPYRSRVEEIKKGFIDTPKGFPVPLSSIADVSVERGPNYISRENVSRKIVVQANVAGSDLAGVVDAIRAAVAANVDFPPGYHVEYGGQFESAQQAARVVLGLSILSIIVILIFLYLEFRSFRQAFLVMVNLPLALIGGIVAIRLSSGVVTIASLVGFVTLFGIAVRNGIMMVSHYNHLRGEAALGLRQIVIQGSLERISPILMTAFTTGLALLPLAFAADRSGNEIQSPMSLVILGGLFTATFLNLMIVPILYYKWGKVEV